MKAIPTLDSYFASKDGQIFSIRSGAMREIASRYCRGYLAVTVSVAVNGRRQRRRLDVHRLVLLAHAGLPSCPTLQTRHLNGDSLDNRADNLAWGTAKQNAADAVAHGTLGPGMKARRRKLTAGQVVDIRRRIASGESSTDLAREYGVSAYYPSVLAKRRHWNR